MMCDLPPTGMPNSEEIQNFSPVEQGWEPSIISRLLSWEEVEIWWKVAKLPQEAQMCKVETQRSLALLMEEWCSDWDVKVADKGVEQDSNSQDSNSKVKVASADVANPFGAEPDLWSEKAARARKAWNFIYVDWLTKQ